jgi:hypothetical protein
VGCGKSEKDQAEGIGLGRRGERGCEEGAEEEWKGVGGDGGNEGLGMGEEMLDQGTVLVGGVKDNKGRERYVGGEQVERGVGTRRWVETGRRGKRELERACGIEGEG